MDIQVVDARREWVPQILTHLRDDQIEGVSGDNLEHDLIDQMDRSMICKIGLIDGKVVLVWGIIMPDIASTKGVIWALTTKEADAHPFVFARHTKMSIDNIRASFSELIGFVRADYKRSIKWLRWLGFTLGDGLEFHGHRVRTIKMVGGL